MSDVRGGCATVGNTVHALIRVNGRRHQPMANPALQTRPALVEPATPHGEAPAER
ncbi:hypothetical protein BH11PSE4_BH11PSE4_05440 [soil metagenome]